ncbi:hypothetical protein HDU76_012315, partial [Blyttiomyces sp. JEL0837]
MPSSLWDAIPTEIKSSIITSSDPLTRYINHDLTQQEIELYATEIWRIAFQIDYNGDLGHLPQDHFPNIHNGLKCVRSRDMYHRLCDLKPSLANWDHLKNVAIDRSKQCECSRNETLQCWKPMRVCLVFKLLVHIPIVNGWMDELPDWWHGIDPFKLLRLACSIGHLHMVTSLLANHDMKSQDSNLNEAFQEAARFGYLDIMQFLWEADIGIDVSEGDFYVMENAAENGHVDVVSFLLDKCVLASLHGGNEWSKKDTFKLACIYGHTDVVKVLNKMVKVESFNDMDKAQTMFVAVQSRKVELVKYLVQVVGFGDEVSCRNAFMNAVEIRWFEGVELLAKVDGVDIAAGCQVAIVRGYDEIVKMLSGL